MFVFVGDVLEVVAALVAAVAVFLIVTSLACTTIAVGACLLPVAGCTAYVARAHGGVPLRSKRAES